MANLTHEPASQRRHQRVSAPLSITIDEKNYRSTNWSIGGFSLDGFSQSGAPGTVYAIKLTIPFQGFDVGFMTTATLQRSALEGRTAFSFNNLNERQEEILRHFAIGLISGDMASSEDTIKRLDIPVTAGTINPYAASSDQQPPQAHRRWTGRIVGSLYVLIGMPLLLWVFSGFYSQLFNLEIKTAMVGAPFEILAAPATGMLKNLYVQPGDTVVQHQLLAKISDPNIVESIGLAQIAIRQAKLELEEREGMLRAQQRDLHQYRQIGMNQLNATRSKVVGLTLQLKLARSQRDRMRKYADSGVFPKVQVEATESKCVELETELNSARANVAIAQDALAAVRQGRFYTNHKLEGGTPELQLTIDSLRKRIELEEQKHTLLLQRERTLTLTAPFGGKVLKSFNSLGTGVEHGKPLLLIARLSEKVIHAYVTEQEANHITRGDKGRAFVQSSDGTYPVVVADIVSVNNTGDDLMLRSQWRDKGDRSIHVVLSFENSNAPNSIVNLAYNAPATITFKKNPFKSSIDRISRFF